MKDVNKNNKISRMPKQAVPISRPVTGDEVVGTAQYAVGPNGSIQASTPYVWHHHPGLVR